MPSPHALTDEQQMIRDTAHELCRDVIAPRAADVDAARADAAIDPLVELGLVDVLVSVEDGGAGGGLLEWLLIVREVAAGCSSTAMRYVAAVMAGRAAKLLGRSADGLGLAWGRNTLALDTADGPSASGELSAVQGAGEIGTLVVPCAQAGGLLLIPADATGVTRIPYPSTLGVTGCGWGSWVLDGARGEWVSCPAEALGELVAYQDLALAAVGMGIADYARLEAARYAAERVQFKGTIIGFQAIRHKLAQMATRIAACEALIWQAAAAPAAELPLSACMARYTSLHDACWVTKESVQIHGGNGYTRDLGAERAYRDAGTLLALGSPEALLDAIAHGSIER